MLCVRVCCLYSLSTGPFFFPFYTSTQLCFLQRFLLSATYIESLKSKSSFLWYGTQICTAFVWPFMQKFCFNWVCRILSIYAWKNSSPIFETTTIELFMYESGAGQNDLDVFANINRSNGRSDDKRPNEPSTNVSINEAKETSASPEPAAASNRHLVISFVCAQYPVQTIIETETQAHTKSFIAVNLCKNNNKR